MADRINQTSLFTFTDAVSGTYRYDEGLTPILDDTRLANHISVDAPDGTRGRTGSGVAVDTVSRDDFGIIVKSITSQLDDGGARQSLAEYQLYLFSQPREVVNEFSPLGQVNESSAWPAILGLEVGDPVTVERYSGKPSPKVFPLSVDGFHFHQTVERGLEVRVKTSWRDTRTYMKADDAVLGLADSGNLAAP